LCFSEREPSCEFRRSQGTGEFQEREGVPACVGDDRFLDALVQGAHKGGGKQESSIVVTDAVEDQLRKPA
jgi:hypothetical protein